jgi:signal transduction histidine kinase
MTGGVGVSGAAFALVAGLAVLVVLLTAAVVVLLVERRRRRRRILELVELLDAALANPLAPQPFADYREGELAVLSNSLHKTCAVLREQASGLRRERDGLADNLANVAHQLRTPLAGMDLALELLARPDTAPDRRRELVRELRGLTRHMGWLCNALLTFARADAGTLELARTRVDAADLVRAASAPLAVAFELKGVEFAVEGAQDGVWFEGDAGWSTEALANVLKNCLEHTPEGGAVRVELAQDAVAARIVVTDTGPGIDPADLPRVFERFYRGRAVEKPGAQGASAGGGASSAGIGLALARTLTVAQGGTLTAANAPAGGARFTFSFPHTTL